MNKNPDRPTIPTEKMLKAGAQVLYERVPDAFPWLGAVSLDLVGSVYLAMAKACSDEDTCKVVAHDRAMFGRFAKTKLVDPEAAFPSGQ